MSNKRKRLIFGVILVMMSLPSITPMLMEIAYRTEMNMRYDINELNAFRADYTRPPNDADYHGNIIRALTVTIGEPYLNAWDDLVYSSDIRITVNGETIETLEDYPVQLQKYAGLPIEGLDRYNDAITYWTVEDKFTGKDFFAVVILRNGYDMRSHGDGEVMPGYVPIEEREFKLIAVQKDGTVSQQLFTFDSKSKLQTQLITESFSGPIHYYLPPGYYYPSPLYPLLYPWITMIIGLGLMLLNFPYDAMKRRDKARTNNE
ncbi:hypothetical protein [Planococcus dechangensis]|uniref:Uncharacterized protein n=1 Tax=Planococcus dechangensis TaxID=1176255 RepID=A0ABV9ME34_9BACL